MLPYDNYCTDDDEHDKSNSSKQEYTNDSVMDAVTPSIGDNIDDEGLHCIY